MSRFNIDTTVKNIEIKTSDTFLSFQYFEKIKEKSVVHITELYHFTVNPSLHDIKA